MVSSMFSDDVCLFRYVLSLRYFVVCSFFYTVFKQLFLCSWRALFDVLWIVLNFIFFYCFHIGVFFLACVSFKLMLLPLNLKVIDISLRLHVVCAPV